MKARSLSWKVAAAVAFLMGLPMVEQAKADSTADIVGGSLWLVGAIIDAAGNS